MPKRKYDELDRTPPTSECDETSSCSSVTTDSSTDVPKGGFTKRKKQRKSVKFEAVSVFYFPRIQGFTCVPSEGGSTLGMADAHILEEDFSLTGYNVEQRRVHKLVLEEQRQQGLLTDAFGERIQNSKELSDDSDSELDELDDYYFLQPLSIRQRRTMLRSSGVKKINITEKDDCKNIRVSREMCGCDCKVYCDPETCSCSLAGIKCQVDRLSFPCGCSKDGCGNPQGRIEFNPIRVRTHFIHTLMRLELDRKEEECSKTKSAKFEEPKEFEKSVLNINKIESEDKSVDLSQFNSNERGSCRDCQNSDVCNVMMQEVQYATMEAEHQRTALRNLYNSPVYKDVTSEICSVPGTQNHLPRVLLFNDSDDDDAYNAENTTSFYAFKQDENYSEASECSSEGSSYSDPSEYNKSYQNLSPFSHIQNSANSEFCAVTDNQSFTKTAQNNHKYIPLNTPAVYKLETMSEMSQHCQYGKNTTPDNWPVTTRRYNSTSSFPASTESTILSCSYTTMTNTTSDEIAANCPGISSHMNSFKEQVEKIVSDKFPVNESTQKPAAFETSENRDSGSVRSFHTMTSVEENPCLVTEDGINEPCPKKSFIPFIPDPNISPTVNPKKNLIIPSHVSYTSSPNLQSLDSKDEILCSQKLYDGDSSPNFGEIIKESIVETVSA